MDSESKRNANARISRKVGRNTQLKCSRHSSNIDKCDPVKRMVRSAGQLALTLLNKSKHL